MSDVAAAAGVSQALVSIVFGDRPGASEETRAHVRRVAAELGYRPNNAARRLRQHRSRVLGAMLRIRAPYQAELAEAIQLEAARRGFEVLLANVTPGSGRTVVDALIGHPCEALLVLDPVLFPKSLEQVVPDIPAVVVGARRRGTAADTVRVAEAHGIRDAVDHLVELGHREIAYLDRIGAEGGAEMRRSYRAAMGRHGLTPDIVPGGFTEEQGAEAARALLERRRLPDAVLASNDRLALGAIGVLGRAGAPVPGAVSVIGNGDSPMARLDYTRLSTISKDVDALATRTVDVALDRLDSPTASPRIEVLEPKLILRDTTARPPRTARPQ